MAACKVNDGEAAMSEGDALVAPETVIVRAAMEEGVAHAEDGLGVEAAR